MIRCNRESRPSFLSQLAPTRALETISRNARLLPASDGDTASISWHFIVPFRVRTGHIHAPLLIGVARGGIKNKEERTKQKKKKRKKGANVVVLFVFTHAVQLRSPSSPLHTTIALRPAAFYLASYHVFTLYYRSAVYIFKLTAFSRIYVYIHIYLYICIYMYMHIRTCIH